MSDREGSGGGRDGRSRVVAVLARCSPGGPPDSGPWSPGDLQQAGADVRGSSQRGAAAAALSLSPGELQLPQLRLAPAQGLAQQGVEPSGGSQPSSPASPMARLRTSEAELVPLQLGRQRSRGSFASSSPQAHRALGSMQASQQQQQQGVQVTAGLASPTVGLAPGEMQWIPPLPGSPQSPQQQQQKQKQPHQSRWRHFRRHRHGSSLEQLRPAGDVLSQQTGDGVAGAAAATAAAAAPQGEHGAAALPVGAAPLCHNPVLALPGETSQWDCGSAAPAAAAEGKSPEQLPALFMSPATSCASPLLPPAVIAEVQLASPSPGAGPAPAHEYTAVVQQRHQMSR